MARRGSAVITMSQLMSDFRDYENQPYIDKLGTINARIAEIDSLMRAEDSRYWEFYDMGAEDSFCHTFDMDALRAERRDCIYRRDRIKAYLAIN